MHVPHIYGSLSLPSFHFCFVATLSAEFGRVLDVLTYLDRSHPMNQMDRY